VTIYHGSGTPIWLSTRDNGNGVVLMQGTSRLMLSDAEIRPVIDALQAFVQGDDS
jgi:hypothetical protein